MTDGQRHAGNGPLNPLAAWPEEAAKLLTAAAGRRVAAEDVQRAIDDGAPALPDGRVNLVELAAWLEREVAGSR